MRSKDSLLHRDDGMAATRIQGETLADLEQQVIERFLGTKSQVLDLGCGKGRTCVYLGLRGFDVVGVEIDLATLQSAKRLKKGHGASCDFVRADGRSLCFRTESFDNVVSFGSILSEKYRLWMQRQDRLAVISEAVRVARPTGRIIASFVHRYWNLRGLLGFMKHYLVWAWERLLGKRAELGDYTELIDGTPVRFHAFTIREARALFAERSVRLTVWRKTGGVFTDWFFVVAEKTN